MKMKTFWLLFGLLMVLGALLFGAIFYFSDQKTKKAEKNTLVSTASQDENSGASQTSNTDQNTTPTSNNGETNNAGSSGSIAISTNSVNNQNARTNSYANRTFGFSLIFPSGWNYHERTLADADGPNGLSSIITFAKNADANNYNPDTYTIGIGKADYFLEKDLNALSSPEGSESVSQSDTTVGGIRAVRYNLQGGSTVYVLVRGEWRYQISNNEDGSETTKNSFSDFVRSITFN